MSKKNIIIIMTILLLILLGVLVGYYFLIAKNNTSGGNPINIIKKLFPFGDNNTSTTTPRGGNGGDNPVEQPVLNYNQKLRKIWSLPVAGAGLVDTRDGTIVRHIERATGHIYETELFSPNQNRLSNTTIPLIYNAFWSLKNNSVVIESLSDDEESVNSYTLTLKSGTTTENNVSGSILSDRIEDISVFGDTVFYLQKLNNSSVGYTSEINSNKSKEVWNSPIKELTSQFVNKNTIALTTKPNESVKGYLYFIDTTNGQPKKIVGDILGLSTLVNSNALNLIYLSESGTPTLSLYDIKNESSTQITPTTFPEKCVWSKKDTNIVYCAVPQEIIRNSSLTDWYMGKISFTDDIWKYDLKNGASGVVSYLSSDNGGEYIDVIKPMLSENERYIVFINKKDNSLWSLDLTK